jgi:hypothetical protein
MSEAIPWGIYSQDENDPRVNDNAILLGVIVSAKKGRALQTAIALYPNPPKRYIVAAQVDVKPLKGQFDDR